jgi:hypothetical protein
VEPSPADSAYFGQAVAVSSDIIVISAHRSRGGTGIKHAGAVYYYLMADLNTPITVTAPAPQVDGYFGYSFALDGEDILVGEVDRTVGSVSYQGVVNVFTISGATFAFQYSFTGTGVSNLMSFGSEISISGDTAAIGSSHESWLPGYAFIFQKNPTSGKGGEISGKALPFKALRERNGNSEGARKRGHFPERATVEFREQVIFQGGCT